MDSFVKKRSNIDQEKIRQINEAIKDRDAVNMKIRLMIYAVVLSFNLAKSSYFKKAVEFVRNFGKGYILLLYHEARVAYLQKEVERIDKMDVKKYRKSR